MGGAAAGSRFDERLERRTGPANGTPLGNRVASRPNPFESVRNSVRFCGAPPDSRSADAGRLGLGATADGRVPAGGPFGMGKPTIEAEFRLPTKDVQHDLAFFTGRLGMRLDTIFPADDPAVAVLSGHGLRLRLERGAPEAPGTIRLLTEEPDGFAGGERELIAPNGTRVEIDHINPPLLIPETEHAFVVRRLKDKAPWIIGRAGMRYRDLIPSRLGGSIIASHIRIPDGGPVPDVVHYHTVGFPAHLLLSGLGRHRLRGSGRTAPPARRRLPDSAA